MRMVTGRIRSGAAESQGEISQWTEEEEAFGAV
jgi:hypothetical protein